MVTLSLNTHFQVVYNLEKDKHAHISEIKAELALEEIVDKELISAYFNRTGLCWITAISISEG